MRLDDHLYPWYEVVFGDDEDGLDMRCRSSLKPYCKLDLTPNRFIFIINYCKALFSEKLFQDECPTSDVAGIQDLTNFRFPVSLSFLFILTQHSAKHSRNHIAITLSLPEKFAAELWYS